MPTALITWPDCDGLIRELRLDLAATDGNSVRQALAAVDVRHVGDDQVTISQLTTVIAVVPAAGTLADVTVAQVATTRMPELIEDLCVIGHPAGPIPVQVPDGAQLHTIGKPRPISRAHPAYGTPCPACGRALRNEPQTLVYVGADPAGRTNQGAMIGGAVIVHAACAGTPVGDLTAADAERS